MAKTREIIGAHADRLIRDAIVTCMETTDCDKIKVADVVAVAKVSRSTFYRYYDSVGDALCAMEDEFLDRIEQINDIALKVGRSSTRLAQLSESMVMRLQLMREHRAFVLAFSGPHGSARFRERSESLLERYLEIRLRQSGVSLPADQEAFYLAYVCGGHYRLVHRWLKEYPDEPIADMAALMNKLLYVVIPSLR